MNRKSFVWLSFAGGLALLIPSTGCHPAYKNLKLIARPHFLGHICDPASIREIGKAYEQQKPEEDKEDHLLHLLLTDARGNTLPESADSAAINSFLEENIRRDYESGRMIILKGWVLSSTEARQCALFSHL